MTSVEGSARRPRRRSATQIGRTTGGPRPVPELTASTASPAPRAGRRTLDNGLDVIVVRKPRTPLIELRLRIPFGGGRSAPRLHAARAEVLASTILLGTGQRDRQRIDRDLADVGGHLNAHVDAQRLGVTGSALSTGLALVLEVLADVLRDPLYRSDDIRGEQARLQEQLAIALTQPSTVARRHLQHRRFGDHPAAWDMPLAEDVAAVAPAAVRALHQRSVVPRGSTLVLVGDLSPARTLDLAADALGGWASAASAQSLATPPPLEAGPLAGFDHAGAVQSQVRLSAPALGRDHEGYPVQQLANLVYGGYFSSRLVENLREDKGFTYSASSAPQFWPGRAALTVSFDTNTESTAAAIWETQYELGRMVLAPPTLVELDSARNYALGTLAASLATQSGYASMISNLAGYGLDAEWLRTYTSRVASVTADEVHALSRTILSPAAFNGVVVGDLASIGGSLSAVLPIELP